MCDEQSLYVEKHLKKFNKFKFRKKMFCISLIITLLLFLICLYFAKIVNPIILSYGEAYVEKLLITASNNAVLNISSVSYNNIININYSPAGEIVSISADNNVINNIANSLAIETQREIELSSTLGIKIPIGTCSGIGFLSGKGNNINLSVNPIGNVSCSFFTNFTSAGINQTSHKIFVKINSDANLILPFKIKKVSKSITYLISECLIVGNVPNTYVNISSLDELYK